MSDPVLEVTDLRTYFHTEEGVVKAVDDLSFRLEPGRTLVTGEMVSALEAAIDDLAGRFDMPSEFVVPGQGRLPALLDVARTVVRRAERRSLAVAADGSLVVPYLNRLSDLLWVMARRAEEAPLPTRSVPT